MHLFQGTHIFGEIYGVDPSLLRDSFFLKEHLSKGIDASGATLCGMQIKEFESGGITILALLAESHASIHSYPEYGSLFFDAFTCGNLCNPHRISEHLLEALQARSHKVEVHYRGNHLDQSKEFHIPSSSGTPFCTEPAV